MVWYAEALNPGTSQGEGEELKYMKTCLHYPEHIAGIIVSVTRHLIPFYLLMLTLTPESISKFIFLAPEKSQGEEKNNHKQFSSSLWK